MARQTDDDETAIGKIPGGGNMLPHQGDHTGKHRVWEEAEGEAAMWARAFTIVSTSVPGKAWSAD